MKEEIKTSTSVLLFSAVVLLIVLSTSPLGYKYDLVPLQQALGGLMIAFIGGALAILAAFICMIIAIRGNLAGDRNLLGLTIFLGLVPLLILAPHVSKALSVPAISDISTDTRDPPEFVTLLPQRTDEINRFDYEGSENGSAAKLGLVTREAYPDLKTQRTNMSVKDTVYRSEIVLKEMGLEIVLVDVTAGKLEATATSFWFGFKDDLVVRVIEEKGQVLIDLRSKSRVGQSDLGVNADRIREFIRRF